MEYTRRIGRWIRRHQLVEQRLRVDSVVDVVAVVAEEAAELAETIVVGVVVVVVVVVAKEEEEVTLAETIVVAVDDVVPLVAVKLLARANTRQVAAAELLQLAHTQARLDDYAAAVAASEEEAAFRTAEAQLFVVVDYYF
jgi:hypothetical protein